MLLREITKKDIEQLFNWVNDDDVRNNAVNQASISWNDHKKWYNSRDFGSETFIYILEDNQENIGQIRFDKIENNYVIDYSIDEKHRGKGYGVFLVNEGVKKLNLDVGKNVSIIAKVKKGNIASSKAFKKCDFSLIRKEKYKGENYYVFKYNIYLYNIIVLSEKKWNRGTLPYLKEKLPNINWFIINEKDDFSTQQLELITPDFIFIPHWSYIIPENIFLNYKCIVFHMTDLPFGRGGSPLQNLIQRGFKETIISALKVVEELDAGPIYLKNSLSLFGTAEEIFIRANYIIQEMIVEIITNNLKPKEQEGSPVLFKRRKPSMSKIQQIPEIDKLFDHIRMLDAEGYPNAFIENEYFRFEFTRATLKSNETILADVRIIKK